MNDIAQRITAEKFAAAIKAEGLTNKQVSEITGINYYYIGKAASTEEFHKAPKWTMEYLRDWANTGEPITRAKWHKLAADFKQATPSDTPANIIIRGRRLNSEEAEKLIKKIYHGPGARMEEDPEDLLELDEKEMNNETDAAFFESISEKAVKDLRMLMEIKDKLNQTITDLKTIIDKWEQ